MVPVPILANCILSVRINNNEIMEEWRNHGHTSMLGHAAIQHHVVLRQKRLQKVSRMKQKE